MGYCNWACSVGIFNRNIMEYDIRMNLIHFGNEGADIIVVIPSSDKYLNLAKKAAKIHQERAGIECDVIVAHSDVGWPKTHNWVIDNIPSKYYVYSCADYFPGRDYLAYAFHDLLRQHKKLIAFNDGKWNGVLATAGLIKTDYARSIYGKGLFYEGYEHNYIDTELTVIAKSDNAFGYCPDAVLIEIDYDKDHKGTNQKDRKLFNMRKQSLFDGKVKHEFLGDFS